MSTIKELLKDLNDEVNVKGKDADTTKIKILLLSIGNKLEEEDCVIPWNILGVLDQDMRKLTLTSLIVTVEMMI